jgi:pimeloyl-ACP methyl ester carboxylesterase
VDVGGYDLQIACAGQGSPAVIIEDALGVSTLESGGWGTIMQAVAGVTRICVYDRAGLGTSDPPLLQPRTSQAAVIDLHRLLAGAGVTGPYLLVGHAIGGLHALLYASQYPDEMAGLVLINATHPHEWSQLQALLPPETPHDSARLARLRALPELPAGNPEGLDVIASARQVRAALDSAAQANGEFPFGDLPLIVLSRSPAAAPSPRLPPEMAQPGAQVLRDLQADLASFSSNSVHVNAAQAGHNLHLHEPDLVIDAILQLLIPPHS